MIDSAFFVTLTDALTTHALRLGYFDRVNKSEPKRAPDYGLTAAIWPQNLVPAPLNHGLAATTAVATYVARIYQPMLQEPLDMIEANMMRATAALMGALSADFRLADADGPDVRNIDLLGAVSPGLTSVAGYLDVDRSKYRVMDISIPIVINDVFEQVG
jgi:hypothetical protein